MQFGVGNLAKYLLEKILLSKIREHYEGLQLKKI